jgi:hypothetical protein
MMGCAVIYSKIAMDDDTRPQQGCDRCMGILVLARESILR